MKKFTGNWGDALAFILLVCLSTVLVTVSKVKAEVVPYVTPDNYGAKHQLVTLGQLGKTQAQINASYPGLGCTTGTMADAAAWRKALSKAAETGKMIIAFGTYFFGPDSAGFPKTFRVIQITGSAYINVTGTDGNPVFFRPRPVDNGDANIMISSFVNIDGLQIGCQTGEQANRIGIDLGPTYNSIYTKVDCFSLKEAIHLRFALNTQINICEAQYCHRGWTADMGNWPGASNSNSQSNVTTFNQCRFNADNSDYAVGVFAASGCVVNNIIIEGTSVRAGIDFDSKGSTVVKDLTIYNIHFECVNGSTEACIKARMLGGILTVDGCFGQYPSVLVDASQIAGTYPFIEVSHSRYWVPHPTKKYFVNNGCNWTLNYNENLLSSANDAPNKFTGIVPGYCPAPTSQCGSNSVSANIIPR